MARWSLAVALDAVDISSSITGTLRVEAEESTSRIASVSFKPAAGVLDLADWVGAAITVDYVADPDGTPVTTRIFTGVVNLPDYDSVRRVVTLECTDDLQGHFEAMDEAAVLAAITGGKYAVEVFGDREDGWQQAQDVLSTVPKSYDLDRDGVTGTLADWAAGTTDFSYTPSTVLDGQFSHEFARLRDLVNRVSISTQYRFTRLHHREHEFGWGYGAITFCDWLADTYELPTRAMFDSSTGSAGWRIQGGILYDPLPEPGTYCVPPLPFNISDANRDQLVTNAAWTAVRRWSQTITETYTITVEDASSVTRFGLQLAEDRVGAEDKYSDDSWDSSTGTATPAWTVDPIGDYTDDQVDRANAANVIETMLQVANTRIRSSHRRNYVTATTLLEPTLERHHTVAIDAQSVSGTGKVFSYTHDFNFQEGTALTEITIAVSQSGTGSTSDALTAPAAPDTEPSYTAPSDTTVLPNRIGNDDTVDDYDETWTGFTGNYSAAKGSPTPDQIYPRRLRIVTPDIEAAARDEVEAESITSYNVQCPDETLVISG